jgi:hypothetical protein
MITKNEFDVLLTILGLISKNNKLLRRLSLQRALKNHHFVRRMPKIEKRMNMKAAISFFRDASSFSLKFHKGNIR